jgi:poly(3-hydroxybutyrate) depolymerase
MMNKFKCILLSLACLCGLAAQAQESLRTVKFPGDGPAAYFYRDTVKSIYGRFQGVSPLFLVYPDAVCADSGDADRLIADLGLDSLARAFSGSVCVMTPVNGKAYDNAADLQAFKDFCNRMRVISNLKVIGLGSGATFVNASIAADAGTVAGIATIGGKPAKLPADAAPVPAFVAGKNSGKAALPYIRANGAVIRDKTTNLTHYASELDPLQQVVVCNAKGLSDRKLIAMAWDEVLSWNYRINNYFHTWYTGCSFDQFGPGELAEYVMTDRLGVERRVKVEDITGMGDYLWYEYHPKSTLNAPKASVPLVILLHGNNNDPRTQAETSGFVELGAREGFVVAELEWQGNGYAMMGLDGIEQVVYHLLKTYPQIDASRVYAEGLSAGSLTATGLGIRKSHVFAAVGAHSAGIIPGRFRFGYDFTSILNEARQKRDAVQMAYFSVTGKHDDAVPYLTRENWKENSFFRAWVAYQTLNGLEVSSEPNFEADSTFGIVLENRRTIELKGRYTIETGDLVKDGVPLMRLNTINEYGHWNFKPDAALMWDYFRHFRRDPVTKKLIYDASAGSN